MTSLINNLEIEDLNKRKEVIKLIVKIIEKYKIKFFKDYINVYFLKIVTARANETNIEIQEK